MPVISIEMASTSPEIKEELIRRLTKVSSEITRIPESSFFVFVKEYPADAIGVGGTPLDQILR
ncbi:MAG: 4-oxalocrotonate tautomerase family protein [Methanospirillum sp.]|nr:4-oxalocrotonate tautomerase family protein [Methanospirillum sp.]